ncbi:MAG: PEP-CTERM sorting domain-containing protein [Gluconacetobacter diazotrophicus]|nr:PEP-CTERM sorting domain-containing protein [Gluconacetobacter diazotrophicus]
MKASGIKNATAGLAGAVALAGGSQAYGAVVSVTPPANFIPTSGVSSQQIPWDVDGNGTADFEFTFDQASTNGNWEAGFYGYGGVGIAAPVGYASASFATITYATRLSAGATISSTSAFAQTPTGTKYFYPTVLGSRYGTKFYGQFTNHTGGAAIRGFIGFEFTAADGQLHYGDIEIATSRYRSATNPGGITFYSAAYNTTAGAPITISAVPEPTSLAALAFGAAGAAGAAWRRKRKAQAAETLSA